MITLAKFGPAFGLSDLSPFVIKAEILLKMAGLDYVADSSPGALRKSPKGKMPYIVDDGVAVADSTFIRFHLEKKYGIDFDAGLDPEQRAHGWAIEKMAEEHLYFALVHSRWMEDKAWATVRANLLAAMPPVAGPLITTIIRRKVRASLKGQGFGRHAPAEIYDLARRDLEALSTILGDKPFLFGREPKAADASVGGLLLATLCEAIESPLLAVARSFPNLVAYGERIRARFYGADEAKAA